MTLKFNSSKEAGNRIIEINIQRRPLDLNKTYTMASCNRTGEPLSTMCRLQNASAVVIQQYTLHDAIEEYLKIKGTVTPKIDGRAIAVDLGTNVFSQMKRAGYQFR
jgi:5'-nucleotidase